MIKIATLVGCAIGDALGNPFEMRPAISPMLTEWEGEFRAGGTFWKGEAGQYTDDTLMSMALSASLIEHQGFNPEDIARKYLQWYDSGNTRGIGSTTAGAMVNLKIGAAWNEAGLIRGADGLPAAGNGTAMRASPIGLAYRNDLAKLLQVATTEASITHNSIEPKVGSAAVALGVALLANREDGIDNRTVLLQLKDILPDDTVVTERLVEAAHCLVDDVDPMQALATIGATGNRGYVPETVASAFYCLAATNNFKDCVIMSIKCGGDTDTTAAVAGALAGTWYGWEGIPEEYHGVENRELLQALTDELLNIK